MNVLAINGSHTPKNNSTTEIILSRFIAGCKMAKANIDVIYLNEKKVLPCDCGHDFACWVSSPGACKYHNNDDMHIILEKMSKADIIVFATPVYLENMTGLMKIFLDRTLPLVMPFIESFEGLSRHPLRNFRDSVKFVILSVCGHHEVSNFDALVSTFEQIAHNLHGTLVAKLLRPHAMLLRKENTKKSDTYDEVMHALTIAGQQIIQKGYVAGNIEKVIQKNFISKEDFIRQSNLKWTESIQMNSVKH